MLAVSLTPRRPGANLRLYIGAAADKQPWIEAIADEDEEVRVVFHAMMLRPSMVSDLGLANLVEPNYGPQRG